MIEAKVVKEVRPEVPERPEWWCSFIFKEGFWEFYDHCTSYDCLTVENDIPCDVIRVPSAAESKWAEGRERLMEVLTNAVRRYVDEADLRSDQMEEALDALDAHDAKKPGAE